MRCLERWTRRGVTTRRNFGSICFKAMTETEQRYAQIEKELLAIVWSCNKFNQYIYGKNKVIIQELPVYFYS